MRKLYYYDDNPKIMHWDKIWSSTTIEQELKACEIETAPRVMFLSYIPKTGKILDAGCGFGKWVIYLSKRGYNIIGVDNNKLVIEKLKNFDNSLQVELGDILNLKYPDNYFDACISMGVVEHFEEGPLSALKEVYRVLKPKGLIFVSTPTNNFIRKIVIQPILNIVLKFYYSSKKFKLLINKQTTNRKYLKKNRKKIKRKKKYYHFLEYRFSFRELLSFLKQSNFEVLKIVPHDFHKSNNHCIGLGVDFPFLKTRNSINFELNFVGKLIARILNNISPWMISASILCVGRSLKERE